MTKEKKLTKSQRKQTVRYLAMKILVDVEQNDAYLNLQLTSVLNQNALSAKDSALLTEIVYGVTQRRMTLDYLMQPYVTKKIPLWLRSLLRISIFQLVYLDKIPQYAVLSEAVEIVKMKAGMGLVKFVNAVLFHVIREADARLENLKNMPLSINKISLETSMPKWLVRYLIAQYDIETAYRIGLSLLDKPALSVRVNQSNVLDVLKEKYGAQPSLISPVAYRVGDRSILESSYFKDGFVTVQDESSSLVALVGQIKGCEKVLDACAAPGGKTTHIASHLNAKLGGNVIALDLYDHKLALIKANAERQNVLDRIVINQLDAREAYNTFGDEFFDIAFVDAPCSGLGLMRRKPDIKYRKSIDEIDDLTTIQSDILESVSKTVKPGGQLIYSTCTIANEENERQITAFLEKHPEYELEALDWLKLPKNCYTNNGNILLLPHLYGTDGFFIAKLIKKKTG